MACTLIAQSTINNGDCGLAVAIPDNNCVDVAINVTAPGAVLGQDVFLTQVKLILAHDWRADVEMTLTAPNDGSSIVLVDRRGGTGDNWGVPAANDCSQAMILSDEGCAVDLISATNKSSASVGRYVPEENFSDLYDTPATDPNGTWNVRVCDQKSLNIGTLEYFELVFEPLGCDAPTMVAAANISPTSVDLSWNSNNNCQGNVVIEYGPIGFLPSNGTGPGTANSQVLVLNCTDNHTLTGLTEITEYDVYIRQTCGTFPHLYNSCKVSFLTDCNVGAVTLLEDFNNQVNCDVNGNCVSCPTLGGVWQNITTDSVDWIVNSGPTGTSKTGPTDDISSGGQYVYLESSFACSENKEGVLLSDCININANTGICHLSFYYHLFGVDINQLKLEGTIDGTTWLNLWQQNGNQGDEWFKVYIDLAAYNNQVMQFRFIGNTTASRKPQADIGLDHIEFYGSQVQPTDILYADKDGDGFGDAMDSISICFLVQPAGFVANKQDCNDLDASIHPTALELPCNGIDENCSGNADDALILNPIAAVSEVCAGNVATLEVSNVTAGKIFWYTSAAGGLPIDSGRTFITPMLMDTTVYYYQEAKDSLGQNCQSTIIPVTVNVNSQPVISNASGPQSVCQATDFDLSTLIIQDENNATDTILFYASDTYTPNTLIGPNVSITGNVIYYIQAVSTSGCTDELSVPFTIETSPVAEINTVDTMEVCFQSSPQLITAMNTGAGVAPFDYEWSIGTQNQDAIVFSRTKDFYQTYEVTITSANGCSSSDAIVVHTLPSVSTIQVVDIQEPGFCQQNGAIQIAPQDGLAPYGYVWNGPSFGITNNAPMGTYTIPSLPMGAYNITVTDAYGCNKTLPQQIVNGPDLSIDSVMDVSCNGEANGAINLSVGGLVNPTFQWIDETNSIISTSEDLLNISAGVYNVIVGSDNTQPCPLDSIVVKEPPVLEVLNIITSAPSCTGFQDGAIELSLTGGTPIVTDYSYAWSNGLPNINKPTNLAPGSYDATVTDAQGCTTTASGTINPTPALNISVNGIDPTCVGGDDGQLSVSVTGGTFPYSYEWTDPFRQNTATAFALKSAIYDLTVTDANGCEITSRDTLFQPPGLVVSFDLITNPSCAGASDGVVDPFVNGGTAPYAFEWSTGTTNTRLVSVPEGFYTLSITDANNCGVFLDSIELDAPEIMDINFSNLQHPVCKGVEDGQLGVSINGGIAPYSYSWNIGTGNRDLSDLSAGNYFLTVTDANSCRAISDTATLISPQGINVDEFLIVEPILCKGLENGEVFLQVSSDAPGANSFTYTWKDSTLIVANTTNFWFSNNSTTLSAGTYELEIKDNIGCVLNTSFELIEPDVLVIDTLLMESPSCNGNEDGSVVANVSGGTRPYTYSWTLPNNSVQRTSQGFLQDISGGNYMLQVIDSSGCISNSRFFTIQEPSPIIIDLLASEPVGCADPEKGVININVSGGQMPYTYEWSSGLTSRGINSLDAGSYTITATDATECLAVATYNVDFEENGLDISLITTQDKSCSDVNDGAITVVVTGGLGSYQYVWSNGTQAIGNDTMQLTNLGAGNYSVSVVDNNDEFLCRGTLDNIVINAGGSIRVNLNSFTNEVACFEDNSGAYDIVVSGGTSPYNYQWSNGSTDQDQANLSTGIYNLTITDANNCTWVSGNFFPEIIGATDQLNITSLFVTETLCAGDNSGHIDINVEGGTRPYQFIWNTGATTASLQGLLPGDYSLTITDRGGCVVAIDTSIARMDQAMVLELSTTSLDCMTDNLGTIETFLTCGLPPYNYLWNTGATSPNLENVPAGNYALTITDASGAQVMKSTELRGPTPITLNNSLVDYRNCGGFISLDLSGGITNSFTYEWTNALNEVVTTSAVASNLMAGTYFAKVVDVNNCSVQAGPFVVELVTPITSLTADVDFSAPSSLGTVRVTSIVGGTPPYNYLWLDDAGNIVGNDSIVRGIPVGDYTVKVTDSNGCEQTTSQIVTSLAEVKELENLSIYPNPTQDYAIIAAEFSENVAVQVELFNAVGTSILRQNFEQIRQLAYPLDFSDLPTGIFYVKIRINDYSVIGRKVVHQ